MLNMRFLLSAALLLLLFSCNQETKYTDSYVHAMVDSIVGQRMEEINRQAMEDLDQRMSIELKQKADSIVAVREAKWREADSMSRASETPNL